MVITLCFIAFLFQTKIDSTTNQSLNSVVFIKKKPPVTTQKLYLVIPMPVQGFFCDFEDNIHRKGVPIDFSLKLKE